jgi:ATP-dependent protease HslVU (ClpYQ) peptidase subunit
MTSIAYRDGELATDSRITAGDMIVSDKRTKVHRLRDGSLVAWSGSVQDAELLLRAMRKTSNAPHPKLQDISALHLRTDGSLYEYEGEAWVKQDPGPYATGSGAPYALAAMDAGASAREAVKIAIKRDANSGGRVQSLKLKDA